MPPRGDRPGHKIGRNDLRYWIATQVVRDPKGFPDTCIALLPVRQAGETSEAFEERISELCRQHTARLNKWIEDAAAREAVEPPLTRTRYDGSVLTACRIYQEHPESDFQTVKYNTRATYLTALRLLEKTVGSRLIRKLTIVDGKKWYREWRKPELPGGKERIDRAHDGISMFRTVLHFMAALGHEDCERVVDRLARVKFEKGGAREQEMTLAQVRAFVKTAFELARKGVIPEDRALYMSIAVAGQFETGLRQRDIIGEWPKKALADIDRAIAKGAAAIAAGSETWVGWFVWEKIPGWQWRTRTSKSKYRSPALFDLTNYSLLMPLLEAVPHADRHGAIVKGEGGLPVRQSSFGKWFRLIARAANIPDDVWNMDTRAGAAGEAEEAGADERLIQEGGLLHDDRKTTVRYIRRRGKKQAQLAEIRQRSRDADGGGTG